MRYVFALALFVIPSFVYAQNSAPNDFVLRIQEDYRNAKNSEEVESITAYCKAKISSLSFKERDRLSVQAIKSLEANKLDEANALFKRVNSIEELDENLGKMACEKK
jgi:hypothetical protein